MNRKIRIMTINTISIVTHQRRVQLQTMAHELKPDIILVQETNLQEFHKPIINGYGIHSNHKGVGTAVLVKNKYSCFQKHIEMTKIDACFVVLQGRQPEEDLLIGSLYIPCQSSRRSLEDDFKKLETISQLGVTCILGGDLNSRHTDWDTIDNTTGKALRGWLNRGDSDLLRISPPEPTYMDSKLDHFLVSQNDFNFANTGIFVKESFADHRAVILDWWPDKPINMEIKTTRKIRDFMSTDWLSFRKKIEEQLVSDPVPENRCLSNEEIDNHIRRLSEIINNVQDSEIPTFTHHKNHYKNIPKEVITLIKHQRTIKKALSREKAKRAPNNDRITELKMTIAQIRLRITQMTKAHMRTSFEAKIMKIIPGPHFFTQVNLLTGRKKCDRVTKIMKDDVPVYKPDDIKSEFTEYYKDLYAERRPQEIETNVQAEPRTEFNSINRAIKPSDEERFTSVEEIRYIVRGLNSKKSAGPDNISNFVIKRLPHSFIRDLTVLLNNCLNNGYFPKEWKRAVMIPIKKKPNASKPKEYRPVSLLSNLGKILECIIMSQLKRELEEREIIPAHQFGFKKGHSTMDALKVFRDDVIQGMNSRRATVACLIDFEKAFDSVSMDGLVLKLSRTGMRGGIVNILQSFLKNRTADVAIDDAKTNEFQVMRGVPQGSKLGPVLYNIYIGDMPSVKTWGCNIIQYADDTIIYTSSQSPKIAAKNLQKAIDGTSLFFDKWGIKINEEKSEVIVLTPDKGNRTKSCLKMAKEVKITIKDNDIRPVKDVKYLGVVIAEKLHFNKHIDETVKKARGAFFQLMPVLKKLEIDQKHRTHLYKQLIRPILTYGFPIWATATEAKYNSMALLERKIIRAITGKYKHEDERGIRYYSDAGLREETGIIDIRQHLKKTCSSFRRRMQTHENPRIQEQNAWKRQRNSRFPLTKHIRTRHLAEVKTRKCKYNRG